MGNVRILAIKVLLSGFIIALVGCSTSRVNDGGYKQFKMPDKFANDAFGEALPSLPERLDDRNDPYIARIGFPRQGDVRVWVKHPDRGEVELYSGNPEEVGFRKKLDVERLYKDPEFGTSLLRLREDVGEVTVRFLDQSGQEKAIRTLRPKTKEWLEDSEEPYSIAFYGCYAPFTPQDSDSAVVFESENPSIDRFSTRFEQLMAANALGEGSGLLPNLKLVVGTGDQVYVDLGYEFESPIKKHPKHPTSGWNTEEPPRPRSRPQQYIKHIDRMYGSAFSFQTMNSMFAAIPQLNVWDDHEIRDGWGSHGDEYVNCRKNGDDVSCTPQPDLWNDYFLPAKRGFLVHQYALGNVTPEELQERLHDARAGDDGASRGRHTLEQRFKVGDLEGFAFDLRTQRNIQAREAAGIDQVKVFEEWIERIVVERKEKTERSGIVDRSPVVIVSSMPLFLTTESKVVKPAVGWVNYKGLKDDLADGWDSRHNEYERDRILKALVESNLRPIFVSGDYHRSVLAEVHLINQSCIKARPLMDCSRVWGYEILASGLRHEALPGSTAQKVVDRVDAQKWARHYIDLNDVEVGRDMYHSDPGTIDVRLDAQYLEISTTQNFASITVTPALGDGEDDEVIMQLVQAMEPNEDNPGETVEIVRKVGRWGEAVNRCTDKSASSSNNLDNCDIVRGKGSPLTWLNNIIPFVADRVNTNPGKRMAAVCAQVPLQEFNSINIDSVELTDKHKPSNWEQCGTSE